MEIITLHALPRTFANFTTGLCYRLRPAMKSLGYKATPNESDLAGFSRRCFVALALHARAG